MFGFQRTGDQFWAFGDARGRGFLLGATAGRTTLNGEGLQHEDGHSLRASRRPSRRPRLRPGVRLRDGGDHPRRHRADVRRRTRGRLLLPDAVQRELRRCRRGPRASATRTSCAACTASEPRRTEPATKAARRARNAPGRRLDHAAGAARAAACSPSVGVAADVWSATSYQLLRNEALEVERWNRLHPGRAAARPARHRSCCASRRRSGPIVAVSDFITAWPDLDLALGAGRLRGARWARTASAAATRARRCAASSRSTPSTSRPQRSPSWRAAAASIRQRRSARSSNLVSIRRRPTRSTRRRGARTGRASLSLMSDDGRSPRMRPFFPTVQDFAAATAPHFAFLAADFGFVGPSLEEQTDDMYDVAFYGERTAVLLNWDTTGSFFACNLAPRLEDGSLDPDYEHWLSVNEVVAARGANERWISQADLDDVDLRRLRRRHGARRGQPARLLPRRAAWRSGRSAPPRNVGSESSPRREAAASDSGRRQPRARLLRSPHRRGPQLRPRRRRPPIRADDHDGTRSRASVDDAAPPAGPPASPYSPAGLPVPHLRDHRRRWLGRPVRVAQSARSTRLTHGQSAPAPPWLDISARVSSGGERGLLGLAFDPDFRANGASSSTTPTSRQHRRRRATRRARRRRADPATARRVLLHVAQPFPTTTAACSRSGPTATCTSGWAMAAPAATRRATARACGTLLGKILRIDVNAGRRRTPSRRPTRSAGQRAGARPEIWDCGLRNPWRFSFDRETGALFIGDVGQDQTEEVDVEPAGRRRPQLRLEHHGGRPLLQRDDLQPDRLDAARRDLLA